MNSRPTLAVVIPAYNAASELAKCLAALQLGSVQPDECFVVDDGSTDSTLAVAQAFGATALVTGGRRGPAYARNLGAAHAASDVLLFLDADVSPHRDTVERVLDAFDDPSVDAVMGSYDDSPACPRFISRYRNLMHCYTHRSGSRDATTFWAGCGAIRRQVFLSAGGFDATYARPAIEDIELGYRLHSAGRRLTLDPDIQVRHWKSWELGRMIRTDIQDRAIPWSLLILRAGRMPNDLNTKWTQRLSVLLTGVCAAIAAALTVLEGPAFVLPLFAGLFLLMGSYWVSEIALHRRPRVALVLALSLAVLFTLELGGGAFPWHACAVVVGYTLLFVRELISPAPGNARALFAAVYVAYVVAAILWLAASVTLHPFVYAGAILMAVVIALNLPFYRFLAAHFGKTYAVASIPFHLLYQIYSGVAFAWAALYYHLVLRHRDESRLARNRVQ